MCDIKVDGVTITLTKDQLKQIDKQRALAPKTVEDINSVQDAEEILKACKTHTKYVESQFVRMRDWVNYQLETIIKAANFIDNGNKEWIPNFFNNSNEYKHYPYFRKENSGWVLYSVFYYRYFSFLGSGFYFKKESSARLIANKHLVLYNKYLPE